MKFLVNAAVVAGATLVGLGLVELTVRSLGLADHLVTEPAYVADSAPGVGNRYKSHFTGVVQGPTRISTNSFGARDREFDRAKAPGTLRIVVMGDSYAFGQGVGADEAFPKVIERALRTAIPGRNVEVINFGVQGYSLGQSVARFITDAATFVPDVAVLTAISDDLDPARSQTFVDRHGYLTKSAGGDSEWKALLRHVHTAYLLKGIAYALLHRSHAGVVSTGADALPAERVASLDREIARFVDATRVTGAAPVFALVDFERTAATDAIVERVRTRFPELPVVDAAPAFAGPDPGTYAVPRDSHPNAEAHRILARLIVERLLELPALRTAQGGRSGSAVTSGDFGAAR